MYILSNVYSFWSLFYFFLSLYIPGVILCIHGKMYFIGCLKKLSRQVKLTIHADLMLNSRQDSFG